MPHSRARASDNRAAGKGDHAYFTSPGSLPASRAHGAPQKVWRWGFPHWCLGSVSLAPHRGLSAGSSYLPYMHGTVARTARDLRLPQVPEAPVDTHRPREATAVDRYGGGHFCSCLPKFYYWAHAIPAHQHPWGVGALNWRISSCFENCRGAERGAPTSDS